MPESVARVFRALGAEIKDTGKSVLDTGKDIAKLPYGAVRLIVGKPLKTERDPKPRPEVEEEKEPEEEVVEETGDEDDDEPGFLAKTGRVVAAPFVFVGKCVIWPFKQVGKLFSSDDEEQVEEGEEVEPEEVEPAEEIEESAEPEETEEPEEGEEGEDEPGFLRKAGRVVVAPFVFVGKCVIWPFKQVVNLFSGDDEEEAIEEGEEVEPAESGDTGALPQSPREERAVA